MRRGSVRVELDDEKAGRKRRERRWCWAERSLWRNLTLKICSSGLPAADLGHVLSVPQDPCLVSQSGRWDIRSPCHPASISTSSLYPSVSYSLFSSSLSRTSWTTLREERVQGPLQARRMRMFRVQEASAGVTPMWVSIRWREGVLGLSLGKNRIRTGWMGKTAKKLSKNGWSEEPG